MGDPAYRARCGCRSMRIAPARPAAQGTDGETPSLPTCRYRPSWPLGPAATSPIGTESLGPSPPRPAAQGTDGETPSLPDRPVARPPPHLKWGILIGAKGRIIVVELRLRLYRRVCGLGGDAGSGDPAYRARCGCRSMRIAPDQNLPTDLRVRQRSLVRHGRGRR